MKSVIKHYLVHSLIIAITLLALPRRSSAADAANEPLPTTFFRNLAAGKKQTVVVYGTSLSAIAEWPKALKGYFDKQFPGLVTFVNAAQSGQQSNWGLQQLQARVLSKNPDLVFIEFSINDAVPRYNISKEKSAENLDAMVKALRQQNPQVDIVIQTMSTVWDTPQNPGRTAATDRPAYVEYYDVYRKYAREHSMPLLDHYPNWLKLQQTDEAKFKAWLPDGTHPVAEGSLAVTWPTIEAMLEKARKSAAPTTQASALEVRIAPFAGDRTAAISYTFDDNLRDQYTLALPMLNEFGFKGTFFVIPGKTAETPEEGALKQKDPNVRGKWGGISWPELKQIAEQGHEIASHTWSHAGLTRLPAEEVDAEISKAYESIKAHIGKPPLTLAFPGNGSNPAVQAVALKHHVAFRSFQEATTDKSTPASLNAWADKLIRDKAWGVMMTHALVDGYAAISDPEIFRAHLRYVKSIESDVWVDTFANVSRYNLERENAKIEARKTERGAEITLIGTLDPAIYDVPLTVVLNAPGATNAKAIRDGKSLRAWSRQDSLLVEAAPGQNVIMVEWTSSQASAR